MGKERQLKIYRKEIRADFRNSNKVKGLMAKMEMYTRAGVKRVIWRPFLTALRSIT